MWLVRSVLYLVVPLIGLLDGGGRTSSAGIQSDFLTIRGKVISPMGARGPVIIEVYNRPLFSHRPLHTKTIPHPGPYEVRIKPGTYYMRAFIDINENNAWDAGEPIGTYTTRAKTAEVQVEAEAAIAEISQAVIVLPLASKRGIDIELKGVDSEKIRSEKATGLEKNQE
jgi:hypothetical protein